jgi:hypothetical protein
MARHRGATMKEPTMAISNRIRGYVKLAALMGSEEAEAMMDAFLQPNWQDVATKDDVRLLAADLRREIGDLRVEMYQGFASRTRWLVGANTALVAVAITVAKLLF